MSETNLFSDTVLKLSVNDLSAHGEVIIRT